jgi:RNA polymerase sigma factor (sigma-70 family)
MPKVVAAVRAVAPSPDERLALILEREGRRLKSFILKRVSDIDEAEDVLQDVLFELVQADRLMEPIDRVGAWLARVARNRIIDLFRKKRPQSFASQAPEFGDEGEVLPFEDLLPSAELGPEGAYLRSILVEELEAALEELPVEQREVFVAHQIEGRTFNELAAETGLNVNTLLARKHYAVRRLRKRLKLIYDEFK